MSQPTDQRHYPPGVPCWVDTEQPDLELATRFYGGLFGWSFTDAAPPGAPVSYLIATLDGQDVAGVTGSDGGSRWNTYVACADADATAVAVGAAGGTVLSPPQDVGPAGRTATVADPEGAEVRLWQAGRRPGSQLVNAPGSWNFSDLQTADLAQAMPFYATVFGWAVQSDLGAGMLRLPGYGDFLAATTDPQIHERQAGAPPGFADVVAGWSLTDQGPGWHVRFTVADRDQSLASAVTLGATVLRSTDTEWTREALIRDPGGAELTISQYAPPT